MVDWTSLCTGLAVVISAAMRKQEFRALRRRLVRVEKLTLKCICRREQDESATKDSGIVVPTDCQHGEGTDKGNQRSGGV